MMEKCDREMKKLTIYKVKGVEEVNEEEEFKNNVNKKNRNTSGKFQQQK